MTVVATVIIPARNASRTLGRQLEALTRQKHAPPFEVIVIANLCSDATADVARNFSDRLDIAVLEANDRPSAAYARNVGAASARGEYLLFCDADDEVGDEWVAGMFEPLSAGRADFVGGMIDLDRRGLPAWIFKWRYRWLESGEPFRSPPLPFAMTASLAVTAPAFHSVGGFDPEFIGAGGEEVLLQRQLLRNGYRLGVAPQARITYSPRTTYRPAVQQAFNYLVGDILLGARAGRPFQRPTLAGSMRRARRDVRRNMVRHRNFNPLLVLAIFHVRLRFWRYTRSLPSGATSAVPSDHIDVCVNREVPIIGGRAFATPNEMHAAWIHSGLGVEPGTLAVISRLLSTGGVFVDVGANVGTHAVAAAIVTGPTGSVIAYEPGRFAAECLDVNAVRHRVRDRIDVRRRAVGAQPTKRKFNEYQNSLLSGFGAAMESDLPYSLLCTDEVDVVSLDDDISRPVDTLKIDIEGFESDVLDGARRVFDQSPNLAVILEVNLGLLRSLERSPYDLLQHFPDSSWTLYKIHEDDIEHPLELLDDSRCRDEFDQTRGYWNLLAVRRGRGIDSDLVHQRPG